MASRKSAEPAPNKKQLVVYFDDGRVERVNPNRPRLQIAFEAEHDRAMDENYRDVCWICWHALGRQGSFDEWVDTVDEIQPIEVGRGKAPR